MKVTPDIFRCEFIGTEAKVVQSAHPDSVGISGRIVDETRNTFVIQGCEGPKTLLKHLSVFHLAFSDATTVEIDGELLVGRPEDRLKRRIKRIW